MDDAHKATSFVLRHEYGRLVAVLLREFGAHRLATVEDGLSQAFVEAMAGFRARGVPPNVRAWIHRAARHRIVDELRKQSRHETLDAVAEPESSDEPRAALGDDVHDDELRALFACAAPSIPLPSQIVFALRTLCGFSTSEVAARLVTSEENVQKRMERAREGMRHVRLDEPTDDIPARTESVLRMVYVLFTEGYFASSGETLLRLELCEEAIRLVHLVAEHPRYTSSSAWALVALMHLHHARRDARTDSQGLPVLFEEQDRRLYRRDELDLALQALQHASLHGGHSKYHLEAVIAAEHAFAPSFADIRWSLVVTHYDLLARIDPSPLHDLHAAIAHSYAASPAAALERLVAMRPPTWLSASHLWLATYADLHRRMGQREIARTFYEKAIAIAPPFERAVLERRMHME